MCWQFSLYFYCYCAFEFYLMTSPVRWVFCPLVIRWINKIKYRYLHAYERNWDIPHLAPPPPPNFKIIPGPLDSWFEHSPAYTEDVLLIEMFVLDEVHPRWSSLRLSNLRSVCPICLPVYLCVCVCDSISQGALWVFVLARDQHSWSRWEVTMTTSGVASEWSHFCCEDHLPAPPPACTCLHLPGSAFIAAEPEPRLSRHTCDVRLSSGALPTRSGTSIETRIAGVIPHPQKFIIVSMSVAEINRNKYSFMHEWH